MKILIYIISILATTIAIFVFFASKEDALLYRLGSMVVGHEPQQGDGAFQVPIGWLIGLGMGALGGGALGYLLVEQVQVHVQLAKLFKS